MGDNRDCSKDSRFLSSVGYVNKINLVGKASIFFSNDTNKSRILKFWNLNESLLGPTVFKKVMIEKKILELQNIIRIKFDNENTLKESLIHKSCNKNKNNEKLEFLGDRVLGLVLAKKLYLKSIQKKLRVLLIKNLPH